MATKGVSNSFVSTKWMFEKAFTICNGAVTQGVNFLKISEGIALLNHGEHTTLGLTYDDTIEDGPTSKEPYEYNDFYTNDMFSFPSNDQLMNIF